MNLDLKDLAAQFDLPEETVTQLSEMVSTALTEAVAAKETELNEAHAQATADLVAAHESQVVSLKESANQYGESLTETLMEQVKGYTNYAVETFINENTERFVTTEEHLRMQSAFVAIREAFESNGFQINENVALDAANAELNEARQSYSKLMEDLQESRKQLDEANRTLIFENRTSDLTDTQVEKAKELLEAVSFTTIEDFTRGVELIVEQAKITETANGNDDTTLNENVQKLDTSTTSPKVTSTSRYLDGFK